MRRFIGSGERKGDDPAEHRNLIDSPDPAGQTARRELEANLQQVMQRIGDPQGYTP